MPMQGPPETPYEGGRFVFKLQLPPEYPLKPPAILALTPNGRWVNRHPVRRLPFTTRREKARDRRFETGVRICTTFSDFHPETWSPSYNLSTILKSLISFMADEPDHYHIGYYRVRRSGACNVPCLGFFLTTLSAPTGPEEQAVHPAAREGEARDLCQVPGRVCQAGAGPLLPLPQAPRAREEGQGASHHIGNTRSSSSGGGGGTSCQACSSTGSG